ncbi:hypothetical protein TCAL_03983 [Tigriopus californicus]|uniref:BSD domain-containing protein n=1 Tax=Tigriopus californicus TaxID=6832 RepID=A0A553NC24_TIGCA|nr:general transcription factor IIH subunit 1-like [Tigriopus californicus]TRY62991.1 hypothetical protein TCAL_03983 [Tigriopus californicus]|eukprot:TCALIF_03983-PA protein Name:"Similar to Tfb1 General transcription factor IIH subunit 1 (Drosophila melanogaster)" AED:0.00 eAED:0.00 QI:0/-1/0/1/-1/1/1/0/568
MSRSAENILVQVANVKHKKNDGTLYLMSERLAWMMKSKSDAFNIVHKYGDIKTQKISPEGKSKIQLQIVLHDGSSTSFHFVNPEGHGTQVAERNNVKEMLVQLLPRFKRKVNKELEEKNRMLSENPGLLQLYKDLVITQIITTEEFWAQHAQKAVAGAKAHVGQGVGVSGSFLGDIKPQADGANGLKYNLTPDIIQSIFKTYPAVKKKHMENVPMKITEQEFWTKFFQSHYFHRDRVHGHGLKDIFTDCAKEDDKSIKEQLKRGVNDTVANISAFSDNTIDENYGASEAVVKNAANIVHQSIIKRFNQHSIMVMRAAESPLPPAANATSTTSGGANKPTAVNIHPPANGSSKSAAQSVPVVDPAVAGKRLREKLDYEDLEAPAPKKTSALNLAKVERYLNGPTPAQPSEFLTQEQIAHSRQVILSMVHDWESANCTQILSQAQAVGALVDLSPGGSLMQSGRRNDLADQCPQSVQIELRQLYTSLCELARHFWACFPPTTPQLQDKAAKMYETLKKFQQVKLRPFENELARNYTSISGQLTSHINQMLESAFRKYASWKQKKIPGPKR